MYLCNDSYAMIAGISFVRFWIIISDVDEIIIFFIADDITEINREKLS